MTNHKQLSITKSLNGYSPDRSVLVIGTLEFVWDLELVICGFVFFREPELNTAYVRQNHKTQMTNHKQISITKSSNGCSPDRSVLVIGTLGFVWDLELVMCGFVSVRKSHMDPA